MRHRGARICILVLLGLAAVGVSAFGQARQLDIWVFGGTIPDRIVPVIDRFNSLNPGIKLNATIVPIPQMETMLRTAIAGKKMPDLVHYWPQYLGGSFDNSAFLDLAPYLMASDRKWYNAFTPGVPELGFFGGKYIAVSEAAVMPVIFYNKDVFATLKLSVPATFEDFLQTLKRIKDSSSLAPISLPMATYPEWWYRSFVISLGKQAGVYDQLVKGEVPFNSQTFVDAADYYKRFYESGTWAAGSIGMSADDAMAMFIQGKAAVMTHVQTAYATIKKAASFGIGVFIQPPPARAPKMTAMAATNGFAVSSTSRYPDESVQFLKYLTSADVQAEMAGRVTGYVPVNIAANVSDPVVKYVVDAMRTTIKSEFWNFSPKLTPYMKQNFPDLWSGKLSPQAFADGMEVIRKETLAAQK